MACVPGDGIAVRWVPSPTNRSATEVVLGVPATSRACSVSRRPVTCSPRMAGPACDGLMHHPGRDQMLRFVFEEEPPRQQGA